MIPPGYQSAFHTSNASIVCVWDQSNLPALLDMPYQLTLMSRAGTGTSPWKNLAAIAHESPHQIYIFIINLNGPTRTKIADLPSSWSESAAGF